jgi:hypothetical protein
MVRLEPVSETRRRGLDGEKDPTHVDVEHPVEIFHVHRRDVTTQQDAGVDNRNIRARLSLPSGVESGR